MRNYLAEIVEDKKIKVEAQKKNVPLTEIKKKINHGKFMASHNMHRSNWNLIAECKLQSPAKGRLCQTHSVLELAKIYEENGASMLSVHTDEHFLGKNEDLTAVRGKTSLPIMRKDFIIDEYQLYEARMLGADAVLLIARILPRQQLLEFLYTAWGLGMDALIEIHDEDDLEKALSTPAEFLGINNRNLTTFTTDIDNSLKLAKKLGHVDNRTLISESGIFTSEDAVVLQDAGFHGILVGEGLVRADDISAKTRELSLVSAVNGKSA